MTNLLGMVHGTSFSHGLIDFLVLSANAQKMIMFVIMGLVYGAIYYTVFRVMIKALNLKTPGREDEEAKETVKLNNEEMSLRFSCRIWWQNKHRKSRCLYYTSSYLC
ncbi:hypothetical protein ACLKMH_12425 [Psychromonas sp. KJ10-10]|uniref:hypothetical protein n=1 Tax=Psychromonas sp. KJ10-10 TaxID=3391823 RepID=UPI0039B6C986